MMRCELLVLKALEHGAKPVDDLDVRGVGYSVNRGWVSVAAGMAQLTDAGRAAHAETLVEWRSCAACKLVIIPSGSRPRASLRVEYCRCNG